MCYFHNVNFFYPFTLICLSPTIFCYIKNIITTLLIITTIYYYYYYYYYLVILSCSMKRKRENSIIEALRSGVSSLTVSSFASSRDLVCRDEHATMIQNFLEEKVHHTLQIFGMPGTGKTATVNYALTTLSRSNRNISAVCLNGYVIQKSSDIYWTLYQHLLKTRWNSAANCAPDQSASLLEKRLRQNRSKAVPLCVIIVDEADKILEKHSKALFRIIDWLSLPNANFKLITISNSMDLNMDAKTKSRLDMTKKLVFEPYSMNELKQILYRRVSGIEPKLFADQAVAHLCHQVASQYGDVRRLLQTASSAVCGVLMSLSEGNELQEKSYTEGIVSMQELHSVIRQTFHDRFIEFLKLLVSPSLFLITCLIARETESLYNQGERDFRVPVDLLHTKAQMIPNLKVHFSRATFVEKLDLLRQVCMIDISIGNERVPLSGIDAIVEASDEVFVSLLQPYQTIIDSCKLHDLWGVKIARKVFA
eukprot:gene11418-7922_t